MQFLWDTLWSSLIESKCCVNYHGFGFVCLIPGDSGTREKP